MAGGRDLSSAAVVVGVDGAGRTHRLESLAARVAEETGLPPVRVGPGATAEDVEKLAERGVVVVDDAHRVGAPALVELTRLARAGRPMLMARRPWLPGPELAELDEVLAAGGVQLLAPLTEPAVAELLETVTGQAVSAEDAHKVWVSSGGLPAVAAALAPGRAGALAARVQRRTATMPATAVRLVEVLALRVPLGDAALAHASGLEPAELDEARLVVAAEGLVAPGEEALVPAVAEVLLADLPAGHRRRVHDRVARALVATGAPATTAAEQLRAARASGVEAAAVFAAAGEELRFDDPTAALAWFDDALGAGAAAELVAAGRAEAMTLVGLGEPLDAFGGVHDPRAALVDAAVAAHDGRPDRAADALLALAPPGPALAVSLLVGTGRLAAAVEAAASAAPTAVAHLARAAAVATEPQRAVPWAIEAAETLERNRPAVVLPDTPHALGAVLAVHAGEAATAVHLLEQALATGAGGPVAESRHRLLLAWTHLRSGRPDLARAGLAAVSTTGLAGRDRAWLAVVRAGLARRSGDVAALRAAWPDVERVLARRSLDLFLLEGAEELAVAAARLRRPARVGSLLADLDRIVDGLGSPPAWVVTLGWIRLQVAVAGDDAAAARAAAERLSDVGAIGTGVPGDRVQAQLRAAPRWAAVLAGEVDADAVREAAEGLVAAELPYEATRLAGDAAIRVADAAAARRLLELARDLAAPADPAGAAGGSDPPALLSERELEVAELVLAGQTHREIGAQLFIAPKTVEHHVARIRTKLGATSRADFFAALNALFGSSP